jgi:putative ABC transport system substrate-binding protein
LNKLGWIEGKTIAIEARFADGRIDRLPVLVRELLDAKVELIVTLGSPALLPALDATKSIPIVMVSGSGDPVGDGLVASLSRPGGNLTGVAWAPSAELLGKLVSMVKEMIPGLSQVALLADGPARPTIMRAWDEAKERLRFRIERFQIDAPAQIEAQIDAIAKTRSQAIYVSMGAATYLRRKDIAELALKSRLATFGLVRELPEAGGLLSYGANTGALARTAASYVDRILKGANPGDLPIDQPTNFELVINIKTAKALGLRVPQTLLQQADHVIE